MEKPFIKLGSLILNANHIVSATLYINQGELYRDRILITTTARNTKGENIGHDFFGDEIDKVLEQLRGFIGAQDDSITGELR
jgi:hypothetical protein